MATKKKLAEQVLLKLSGGMVKPDSQTDIREIMADLDWLRDEYVKKNYFLNKNFGSNVIDQEYLGEYSADLTRSDQLVMLHGDSFELPHKPIALPRNEGIQAVYEDISGKHYLIIDGAQAGIYRGKRALDVPDRSYVYFTGGTGHIISNVSEWFLPSIDELSAIQENLYEAGIGNLYWGDYWSSSESTANFAYEITMFSGSISDSGKSSPLNRVRPVRSFESMVGSYSIGDIGPGGGWIFLIDDNTHYEMHPEDLDAQIWSNVDDEEVGIFAFGSSYIRNGEEIGDGKANTIGIISQTGHTESAALNCLNTNSVKIRMAASSESIGEDEEFPLPPDATSEILDRLFEKYIPKKQIPHDEVEDGQK